MVVIDGQKYWYRLVSVSLTDTLAFDTKYWYRYRWISNIVTTTSIGIAEAQTPILVLVSLKKYLCNMARIIPMDIRPDDQLSLFSVINKFSLVFQ